MITIGINKHFGIRSKFVMKDYGDYLELLDDEEANYHAGRIKPNYPMPAIRYYVAWDKDRNRLLTLRW